MTKEWNKVIKRARVCVYACVCVYVCMSACVRAHLYIYELFRYYILKSKLDTLYLSIVINCVYITAQFDPY